jgi:hypothetical protein
LLCLARGLLEPLDEVIQGVLAGARNVGLQRMVSMICSAQAARLILAVTMQVPLSNNTA